MTDVSFDGGEVRRVGRSARTGRLRRPLLLIAVALLCGASYFAGIWHGMNGQMTCTVSGPGLIECGTGDQAPPAPSPAPEKTGSA